MKLHLRQRRSELNSPRCAHFVWLLVGVWLCSLSACDDDPDPILWEPPASGQIVAPGAAEGVPGARYEFRFEGENIPAGINYVWLFDDGSDEITLQANNSLEYDFAEVGRYFVLLRLVAQDGGYEIARFVFEANIRADVQISEMRKIAAGSFTMGGEILVPEQPEHRVTLTRDFEIGIYEVTQAEYTSLMGDNPSWFEGAERPVENINWYDAVEYCNRLSRRMGLELCYDVNGLDVTFNPEADGYRLPTEAEWEFACRAGTNTDTYAGDLGNPRAQCIESAAIEPELDKIAWLCFNSDYETHAVGQKEANDFELYDMLGNVAEFVWDYFEGEYYRNSPQFNPTGPLEGELRIVRGSSYSRGVIGARSSSRRIIYPRVYSAHFGLRLARNAN